MSPMREPAIPPTIARLKNMGVEGIVLSPGYSYEMAPDQHRFLGRARVRRLFRAILSNRKPNWKFNMSPLFLEFLMGDRKYECTPWGSPAYNIFGWQRPCYLLQDGYAETFKELLETTKWEEYAWCERELSRSHRFGGNRRRHHRQLDGNGRPFVFPRATGRDRALVQIENSARTLEETNV